MNYAIKIRVEDRVSISRPYKNDSHAEMATRFTPHDTEVIEVTDRDYCPVCFDHLENHVEPCEVPVCIKHHIDEVFDGDFYCPACINEPQGDGKND